MASADAAPLARTDGPLSNPWLWMAGGLAASGAALLWVRCLENWGTPLRFALLFLGLLGASVALILRMRSSRPAYLDELAPRPRLQMLLALSAAGWLLVVCAVGLLLAGLAGLDVPWTNGSLVFLCVLVVPGGVLMGRHFFLAQRSDQPVSVAAETAALLVLAAVTSFLGCWALYLNQERANDWDSIRLFLAMMAAVAFLAAPLLVMRRGLRRLLLSLLFLFHLSGIVNAALAAPPAPWLASRIWTYIYRPYLEFMYLNNAYHFYAPEPGPSGYLEYRILYRRPTGDGNWYEHWKWGRVADMDEGGNPRYMMSIQYQRRIALVETVNRNDPAPAEYIFSPLQQRMVPNPIYYWRQVNSTQPPEAVLGQPKPEAKFHIPYHPDLAMSSQYRPSIFYVRKLMEAFAHHIASLPPPYPDDEVVNVKIYRQLHVIPPPEMVVRDKPRFDPLSPNQFLPYFQGTFDKHGKLKDAPVYDANGNLLSGDPLLYWVVPILKDNPYEDNTTIRNYQLLHAGDDNWIRYPGMQEWSKFSEERER